MGQARTFAIGLALVLGQTAAVYRRSRPSPPPPPEPCIGCVGPWYLKGFVGAANPNVGGIDDELIGPNFGLSQGHEGHDALGLGFGYDTGHYFRFDIYRRISGQAGLFLARQLSELGRAVQHLYRSRHLALRHAYLGRRWLRVVSVLRYEGCQCSSKAVAHGLTTRTNFAWRFYGGLSCDCACPRLDKGNRGSPA